MIDPFGIDQSEQIKLLLGGDPVTAMEAAKKLIKMHGQVDPEPLIRVLEDPRRHLWSRIAAAYALGFLEHRTNSGGAAALLRVLENSKEEVSLRSHAAEALSNLGATEAVSILRRLIHNPQESERLQKWCHFALSELKSGDE